MVDVVSIAQMVLSVGAAVVAALIKWGMTQRDKLHAVEMDSLKQQVNHLSDALEKRESICDAHTAAFHDLRNQTETLRGYISRVGEDFSRALESMEKVNVRLNELYDRVLKKEDLKIWLEMQRKV